MIDETNFALRKVVDSAVKSTINIDETASLMDLYVSRKKVLNLSDRQIQKILGMDRNTLNPILQGTAKHINFINVLKLAHFFGVSVNDFAKLYIPEMDTHTIGEIERSRQAGFIIEYFDISVLMKMKFLKKDSTSKDISDRITRFFGLDVLYDYSNSESFTAFSRSKRSSNDLMRNFWVQSALGHFAYISNPNPYRRDKLIDLIPKIRPYTRDVKSGLIKVLKALYNIGVTVIFQQGVEKLQVRGATMAVNGKPCIVLSDVQNNYPTLWFALLHELHHVLFDFEEIEKRVYHISSGEGDLFLMDEGNADSFARDYLLNDSRLKFASGYIASNMHVEKLAKEWGVHPSIIYSIYCYETNEWAFYGKYIPKMDEAIALLNTHPFEKETLIESARKIKELIS